MKWIEIVPDKKYSKVKLFQAAIEHAGIDIQFATMESHGVEMSLANVTALAPDADLILLSPFLNLKARDLFTQMRSDVYSSNEFDVIRKVDGKYWPFHFHQQSLGHFIAEEIGILDRNAAALIAGHQIFPSAVAMVIAQLGFKQVRLVAGDEGVAKAYIDHWSRSYFSIDWASVDTNSLTEDSGRFSLLINCEQENESVLKTLYYFNFLQPEGVVIDYRPLGNDCDLIREAREIQARPYSGKYMFAQLFRTLIEELNLGRVEFDGLVDTLSRVET